MNGEPKRGKIYVSENGTYVLCTKDGFNNRIPEGARKLYGGAFSGIILLSSRNDLYIHNDAWNCDSFTESDAQINIMLPNDENKAQNTCDFSIGGNGNKNYKQGEFEKEYQEVLAIRDACFRNNITHKEITIRASMTAREKLLPYSKKHPFPEWMHFRRWPIGVFPNNEFSEKFHFRERSDIRWRCYGRLCYYPYSNTPVILGRLNPNEGIIKRLAPGESIWFDSEEIKYFDWTNTHPESNGGIRRR